MRSKRLRQCVLFPQGTRDRRLIQSILTHWPVAWTRGSTARAGTTDQQSLWTVRLATALAHCDECMLLEAAGCKCTLQMQPSARPVYPRARRPHSTCSSGLACNPHAFCACP